MEKKSDKAIHLFYCYATEDGSFVTEIERSLALLKQEGLLRTWNTPDQQLLVLPRQIQGRLDSADLVVCIISAHFLANDFSMVQVKRTIERQKTDKIVIIPILAEPSDFKHSPLRYFQALPRTGQPISRFLNRNEAFKQITDEIRYIIQNIQ